MPNVICIMHMCVCQWLLCSVLCIGVFSLKLGEHQVFGSELTTHSHTHNDGVKEKNQSHPPKWKTHSFSLTQENIYLLIEWHFATFTYFSILFLWFVFALSVCVCVWVCWLLLAHPHEILNDVRNSGFWWQKETQGEHQKEQPKKKTKKSSRHTRLCNASVFLTHLKYVARSQRCVYECMSFCIWLFICVCEHNVYVHTYNLP